MSRLSRSQSFNDSEEVLDKDKHEALTLDGTEKVDFRDEEAEEDEGLCGYGMSGVGEKKRRLRVDQVQALEIDFQVENKLDPDRKQRLAQDLGLQPRQVAVWFQNRRARRKTKQIERGFVALRTRHDALKLDCDALRRDNEALESLIRELEAELRNKTGEEERPHAIYKEGSPESDSSVVFNGEATLHEHCLTECRTQTEDKSGDDKGGCLDEELVGGRSSAAARSFFIEQPAQDLHCYCSDDWD